jgi:hypothetical protein
MKLWLVGVVAFLVGAVVALVVVGLVAYHGVGTGWPQPERALVQSGVQSVTICDEHHARIFDRLSWKIPGVDVGLWGPKKKSGCHVWYHYAEGEE